MKINNVNKKIENTNFKGNFKLSPLSNALYVLNNNDMLNASFLDVVAMDTPRTFVEFKERGKQAGIEMGFREYTGTFIAEFSAIVFALFTSKIFSKIFKPKLKINEKSWVTNNALDTFKEIYQKSDKTLSGFIDDTLGSIKGNFGNKVSKLENTRPLREQFIKIVQTSDKKQVQKGLKNFQNNIINILKADNIISVKSGNKEFNDNLSHVVRDMYDVTKNIFFNGKNNSKLVIEKLKTLNKTRIAIAMPFSMALAFTNQYLNRYLTKKRTGIDNFVGENDYENNVKNHKEVKKEKNLFLKKLASAGIFTFMLGKVMGIKSFKDIVSKLEFNSPATGGNAIKTIYGGLILGRIFASKDSTELRETNVRDYLGFLNWLVLGGFVSKTVGQVLDPKHESLFNITKKGKGFVHWLYNVSLKSQKEIIAQGGNVQNNLKKLNIAQISGIVYSAIMLGVMLPKLNIWMTKNKKDETASKTDYNKNYKIHWE